MIHKFQRIFLDILIFWLPVPVTLIMTNIWWRETKSLMITSTAVGLPLLYGYVIPGIGINILQNWRFTNGVRIGGMYLHHGFMYASKMSFFGFIPLLLSIASVHDSDGYIYWVIISTTLYASTAWLQDYLSHKFGYVVFHEKRGKDSKVKENASLRYAPICFPIIGSIYSISLVAACKIYLFDVFPQTSFVGFFVLSFLAMATIPSIAYGLLTKNELRRTK
ncbi:MAG: hypothetical protein C4575_11315 [Desulforudis sp.]|nr:MAG: hypothetical protein C4575_11315 [Desulforudis sp.]